AAAPRREPRAWPLDALGVAAARPTGRRAGLPSLRPPRGPGRGDGRGRPAASPRRGDGPAEGGVPAPRGRAERLGHRGDRPLGVLPTRRPGCGLVLSDNRSTWGEPNPEARSTTHRPRTGWRRVESIALDGSAFRTHGSSGDQGGCRTARRGGG